MERLHQLCLVISYHQEVFAIDSSFASASNSVTMVCLIDPEPVMAHIAISLTLFLAGVQEALELKRLPDKIIFAKCDFP